MKPKKNPMLELMRLNQEFFQRNDVDNRYPFEVGEIINVESDGGYQIKLEYSGFKLSSDDMVWLIDDEDLAEGDMVGVAFDATGDPVGIAALSATSHTSPSTIPTTIVPMPTFGTLTYIPTTSQATFRAPASSVTHVYASGMRVTPRIGFLHVGSYLSLTSPAAASTPVIIDFRIDP